MKAPILKNGMKKTLKGRTGMSWIEKQKLKTKKIDNDELKKVINILLMKTNLNLENLPDPLLLLDLHLPDPLLLLDLPLPNLQLLQNLLLKLLQKKEN